MGTPGRRLPPTLALLVALAAAPGHAFDLHDIRYFRETGYRWCRACDLSFAQFQGADLT